MDYTCYYVSPSHVGLAVPDVATARDKCRLLGSVLYEPRTRNGMTVILGAEMDSSDQGPDSIEKCCIHKEREGPHFELHLLVKNL